MYSIFCIPQVLCKNWVRELAPFLLRFIIYFCSQWPLLWWHDRCHHCIGGVIVRACYAPPPPKLLVAMLGWQGLAVGVGGGKQWAIAGGGRWQQQKVVAFSNMLLSALHWVSVGTALFSYLQSFPHHLICRFSFY